MVIAEDRPTKHEFEADRSLVTNLAKWRKPKPKSVDYRWRGRWKEINLIRQTPSSVYLCK